MKRLTGFLFVLASVFALLVGCSDSGSTADSTDSKDSTEKNDKTLIIGIDDTFAPLGFRNENNEIVGFDIDMAKAAAEKMDVEVKIQPIDWKTKENELSSGRIDLIWNGYTITD